MSIIKADALEATAAFNPQHVPQHAVIQTSLAEATLSEEIDLGPPAGMTSSAGSDGAAPAGRLAARLLGAAEEKSGEERLRTRPGQQDLGSSLNESLKVVGTEMSRPVKEVPVVDPVGGAASLNPSTVTTSMEAERKNTVILSRLAFYSLLFAVSAGFFAVGFLAAIFSRSGNCNDGNDDGPGDVAFPTPQPTIVTPQPTIATADPCDDVSFSSSLGAAFFVGNGTLLAQACIVPDVGPFIHALTSALRFESIVSNLFFFLFLCIAVQLGGIPSIRKGDKYSATGVVLWVTWMIFALLQYFATFAAQLMGILATFSVLYQYPDELVAMDDGGLGPGIGAAIGAGVTGGLCAVLSYYYFEIDYNDEVSSRGCVVVVFTLIGGLPGAALGAFYGSFSGAAFFGLAVPSLVFHPSFLAKNAALLVYAFTIFQGIAASGLVTINVDSAMRGLGISVNQFLGRL